jgi:hypothetical protein
MNQIFNKLTSQKVYIILIPLVLLALLINVIDLGTGIELWLLYLLPLVLPLLFKGSVGKKIAVIIPLILISSYFTMRVIDRSDLEVFVAPFQMSIFVFILVFISSFILNSFEKISDDRQSTIVMVIIVTLIPVLFFIWNGFVDGIKSHNQQVEYVRIYCQNPQHVSSSYECIHFDEISKIIPAYQHWTY